MKVKMSYFVVIKSVPGDRLLGGVITFRSSRFERKRHAEALGRVMSAAQTAAGRKVESVTVRESKRAPEIYAKDVWDASPEC